MPTAITRAEFEETIIDDIAQFRHDPLGYVQYAIPWTVGELEGKSIRPWQRDILVEIGDALKDGASLDDAIQLATASGHGIGKSALVAWIILWAMSTMPDCKGVITANTETQLRTKTWAEVGKWHRLSINAHWFNITATAIFSKDPKREKTWRVDAIPWSERNTEAFAGLHNEGKRVLLIFDEASAIPDAIWEVAEGAMTDENTEIIWCVFGNPTRNTGRFKECFGRLKHRWSNQQIDSRSVEGTNKKQFQKWVEDYGEDSDFVRVRVRGVFPRAGSLQLIPSDIIYAASTREATCSLDDPLIMTVDVARFGDDQSVIRWRKGFDATILPVDRYRGVDTMTLAARCASLIHEHSPDGVFIDETGIGGGVVDRLRQLGYNVFGINFGAKADGSVNGEQCANKRAEMYVRLREWLKIGGAIGDDRDLVADLEGIEFGYDMRNYLLLEKKADAKKRGLNSPDDGDALALSFAHPVAISHLARPAAFAQGANYDPFA